MAVSVKTNKTNRTNITALSLLAILLALYAWGCTLSSAGESKDAGTVQVRDLKKGPALDVPYEPTSYAIAEEMLLMADVRKDDLVYDLGCGDGRIVIMAAKQEGAQGVGVDLDPDRIRESIANARKAGVTDKVRFLNQDLFKTDFKDATVVMLYLWPEVNLRLRPRLLAELKPGTRVVSHSHTMGDWEPDARSQVSNHNLYLWIIPANVTGVWTWSMPSKDGHTNNAILRLTQHYQEVKGSFSLDGAPTPITEASLRGDHLQFTIKTTAAGQTGSIRLDGRVQGNRLTGTAEQSEGGLLRKTPWEAKRQSE